MVEGEGRGGRKEGVDGMPQGACSVASSLSGRKRWGEEEVGDGEDGAARIAAFRPVGEELFEVSRRSDTGFLLKLACCRLLGLFALAQKAAGECQVVLERLDSASHDEGMERVVDDRQGDDVDRDGDGEGRGHGLSLAYLCRVDIKCDDRLSSF